MILVGIPKHFDIVWRSYYQKVIQANPNFHIDVYLNFYADVKTVTNVRNQETNVAVDTLETVKEQFKQTGTKVNILNKLFGHIF
jgi:hypothetical protein